MSSFDWFVLGLTAGFLFVLVVNKFVDHVTRKALETAEEMGWTCAQFNEFWWRNK